MQVKHDDLKDAAAKYLNLTSRAADAGGSA